jgi:hypothetical protein
MAQASLVSGYSPTRPSTGCVEDHLEPLRSVRRRSDRTPVATGYCYRLRTECAGFSDTNGRFTLRILAERQGFEPWDLVGLRFSRAHQRGRGGPLAFDLSVKAFDLAPNRPPLFVGEDASEAAKFGPVMVSAPKGLGAAI